MKATLSSASLANVGEPGRDILDHCLRLVTVKLHQVGTGRRADLENRAGVAADHGHAVDERRAITPGVRSVRVDSAI